jgi:serine/threonine protein kinase
MPLKQIPKSQQIKLLSQGSYGCIIRPNVTCSGKVNSTKYITKIQKKKAISDKEEMVGKKIRKINRFADYFAPILESCEISYATIDGEEIKKCDFIKDASRTFLSNKIRYVGKQTLFDYLFSVLQYHPTMFIKEILRTYNYLLSALSILNSAGIIHFDLKENNIMCEDGNHRPILIDFGLSLDTTTLTDENLPSYFFAYGAEYEPWCIDICVITYIINNVGMGWQTKNASSAIIQQILDDFIKKNHANQYLTETELGEYKTNLQTFFSQFVGKSWKQVVDELLKYHSTWDNNALAIIYLNVLDLLGSSKNSANISITIMIKQFLKSIIMSMPNTRPSPNDTKTKMRELFKLIPRIEHNKIQKILEQDSKNIAVKEIRQQEIAKSKRLDAVHEHNIYNKHVYAA